MPKVTVDLETSVPPDQVRAALLDFSPQRPVVWPGIEPSLYEVYSVGESSAIVKEGSRLPGMSFWAVEEYDWSDASTITWTVRESNFCAPGGQVSATIGAQAGGGSLVQLAWNRTPTSFPASIVMAFIVLSRGRPVVASFAKAMQLLERAKSA